MNEYTLNQFIDDELSSGALFEDILEDFGLTPGEVFVLLFNSGHIDPDLLESYLLDV